MEPLLSESDKSRLRDLYENRLALFGPDDVRTVGWSSQNDQYLRFDVLFRGLNLTGKTILDVGCGLGDVVPYLDARLEPTQYEYIGVDICPKLISEANMRHGGTMRRFLHMDILQESCPHADIVVSSGALSFKLTDNLSLAKAMIDRMFNIADEVLAINFLTSYIDYQLEKNYHYDPSELFAFAKSLTRWVNIYHDYPLWEFTMQLRHQPWRTHEYI